MNSTISQLKSITMNEELKHQREKMANWNKQRAKNEENGMKQFFRMKEAFSNQKIINSACDHKNADYGTPYTARYCPDCKIYFV